MSSRAAVSALTPVRRVADRLSHPLPVAGLFATAGTLHLVDPRPWERAVPDELPYKRELVYLSGVAELVGAALVLHPGTRRWSGPYLTALLVAVFPANLQMARTPERYLGQGRGARALLLARLPLQAVLVAWVRRVARQG